MSTLLLDIENIEIGNGICRVWISKRENQDVSIKDAGIAVSHRQLIGIRAKLIDSQRNHRDTRGFHGAIIWEFSTGKWFACEDIGRHNTSGSRAFLQARHWPLARAWSRSAHYVA